MKIIAVFFTVICVLVLDILCQLSTYQSRYRLDCEYKQCMKPIRNHGNCPRWGSCQWYCQAKLANCTVGTRYHCARNQRNLDQFTNACAVAIFCLSGEEPHLSVQETTGKASVNCRPCYKTNVYNSRLNTSSATFSECKMLKKNLCRKEDNKINCGNQNYTELTKTDGYCRCDARNGYAARSQKMCFYEYEVCFVKKCPEGRELLLNYTCGMLCPTGYARQPASDICTEVSLARPFTSDRPVLKFTEEQTTSIRTLVAPSANEQLYKQIIILISLSMVIVTILFRRQLKEEIPLQTIEPDEEKPEVLASNSTISSDDKLEIVTDHFSKGVPDTDTEKNIASEKTVQDSHRPSEAQTRTDTTATYKRSSKSQTRNYTPKDRCKEAYASLKNNEVFTFDEGSLYDNLKEKWILEPTNCDTIHSIDISGFETYGIPGVETADLYLLISHLLCGNDKLKGTLQLAAARYGIQNFDTYRKALLKEFNQSKTPLIEARIFFELHGIYFNDFNFTKESVSIALDNLFHQLAVTGSTGPFHATLLGGVLDCNLVQHFENNDYHDRDVRTTAGFKVALESSPSRRRELHIVWIKSANYPHRYCVRPAFQIYDTTITKQIHIPQLQNEGMAKSLIEKIKEQKPYKWRSCFKVLERSQKAMFDDLKEMEFIKPNRIIRTINVPGYKAYTKPREENTSVYEWVSLMLCGDKSLMYILRLAAARYAMKHFETYVDKLNKELNGDENPFNAAKVFFKSHEIDFEENGTNVRGCVSVAFRKLVNETVNSDKGNAPYYVDFLSGVLNRKIIQHFEDNKFYGQVVESIRGLDVSLTTELSSDRDLHMYWMKSSNYKGQHTYQIVPLYRCNPKRNGKDLCEDVYELLMGQVNFESDSCLEMIDAHGIDVFEELKGHAILKHTTDAERVIHTITIPGYIAYERPDGETTCLYEHTSRLLFGNTEKKFILRLAAIRYALQNYSKYVKQLADAFVNSKSKTDAATTFFRIHCTDFKRTKKSPLIKDVGLAFVDLLRETVNTGQGPFYVEFLRGALNCKITQHFENDHFYKWDICAVPGLNVCLVTNTPPDRELHIYWMKTSRGRSYTYQLVSLVKNVDAVPC